MKNIKMISASLAVFGLVSAQPARPQNSARETITVERVSSGVTPRFSVMVVARTAKAINYRHRGGATKIDFRGTELLPLAHGEAKVESKQGYIEIEVEFDNLQPATKYGVEYLTYVLWAITPEGRTANLGEILLNGTRSKLDVTTELQVFSLLVTAEPYFAVTRPSDVIVMENQVRKDTAGKIEEMDAKYELLQRGQYEHLANPLALKADPKVPLEVYEARNAVQIARATGADQYASETLLKAENSLQEAQAAMARRAGRKPVTMSAREAVQTAEDARALAERRQEKELLANERQAGAERESRAENERAAAQSETERVTRGAEAERVTAQAQAERLRRENDMQTAAAQAEADRLRRENEAQRVAAETEADRLKRENAAQTAAAQAEADRLRRENEAQRAAAETEADRLKRENDAERAGTQADLDRANREKAQAEAERTELRAQLLRQFNVILETRDTARGLIINMSDVLFDTAKYSLRPLAREKLAKVSGIISAHPGLRLDVEGHTDSVGGDDYNQQLSEQRGVAVRDYLTGQGMPASSVTTRGFGKTQPVASNETAEGRQKNRRVELVVSGDIIGAEIGSPVAVR